MLWSMKIGSITFGATLIVVVLGEVFVISHFDTYISQLELNKSLCKIVNLNSFCRYGRVNYVLARRLELLREVGRLQESLGVPGDVSYTCETAGHFFLYQVRTEILYRDCMTSVCYETCYES